MAFRINSVTIDGNLTRDPDLRALSSGDSVCNLRIAHNSRRKNQHTGEWEDVPHYFDVTFWKGEGEWIAKEMRKGDKIVVQGELRWREYTDNNGNKRQAVEINGTGLVPVPRGDRGSSSSGGSSSSASFQPQTPAEDFAPPPGSGGGFQGAQADDDIPF